MANFNIIDRRLNPSGKNLSNRQRFLKKATEQLARSVRDGLSGRSISSEDDQDVGISKDGISEPTFRNNPKTGKKDYVLPGNKEYLPGDIIQKPESGDGDGSSASEDGDGDDDFHFQISKEEYHSILFEGLELPALIKRSEKDVESFVRTRAGFTSSGTPSTLDLEKSMIKSLGRRVALKNPKLKKIAVLEAELSTLVVSAPFTATEEARVYEIKSELEVLRRKANAISYLDPVDLRYKNYEKKPVPKHQAVMFCIMDVSGSMGEHEKSLAKRFYMLLYLFLSYKYEKVDIVFIRHHSRAMECTEQEFFYLTETGGTVVSTAFAEMDKILNERYTLDDWNIYAGYCSDGDNFDFDNDELTRLLNTKILPIVQFFTYLEVSSYETSSDSNLWKVYETLLESHTNMKMDFVHDPEKVYPIFRKFFEASEVKAE